jgi:hypothetical protein
VTQREVHHGQYLRLGFTAVPTPGVSSAQLLQGVWEIAVQVHRCTAAATGTALDLTGTSLLPASHFAASVLRLGSI